MSGSVGSISAEDHSLRTKYTPIFHSHFYVMKNTHAFHVTPMSTVTLIQLNCTILSFQTDIASSTRYDERNQDQNDIL